MLMLAPSPPLVPTLAFFFFFNDTATTEIYTLSLHDALPISSWEPFLRCQEGLPGVEPGHPPPARPRSLPTRSEEHTSELQSQFHLVCRLLLEKKKKKSNKHTQQITQKHK